MSVAHLAILDRLAEQLRDALARLGASDAPDLEAFDATLRTDLDALAALGPIDPQNHQAARCRARLEDVQRMQAELSGVLGALRQETGRRMGRITHGRRSIGAYRSSFQGGRRGAKRGQG